MILVIISKPIDKFHQELTKRLKKIKEILI